MKFKLNDVLDCFGRRARIRYRRTGRRVARIRWSAAVVIGKPAAAQSIQILFLRRCHYAVTFARLDKRLQGSAFFRGVGVIDRMIGRIDRVTPLGAAAEDTTNDDRDQPEEPTRTRGHWLTLPPLGHDVRPNRRRNLSAHPRTQQPHRRRSKSIFRAHPNPEGDPRQEPAGAGARPATATAEAICTAAGERSKETPRPRPNLFNPSAIP